MLSKKLFILAHQIGDRRLYPTYKKLLQSQWKPYSEQKKDQEKQLRHMICFAHENVPYYHKLFNKLNLTPSDINTIEDLERLPILTKDTIKENWEDFKPLNLDTMKYYANSTGGSTGTPFRYRLSKYDRFLSGAILYRGWGSAGYELGDRMVFLGGSSLDIGSKSFIIKKAHEISRNIRKLSSFDMGVKDMQNYADIINSFGPKYLRGYPSSISFFADYIKEYDVKILPLSGVFTTSEKLLPTARKNIEDTLDCDVYDGYGLNDGGVSAYECSEHNRLHIDTERSIMEVVDNTGTQMEEGIGGIVATSLHNYAMPFIRYDTGDMGHITKDCSCGCGRGSMLMKEVVGRSVDILHTPEGKAVHGWFFLYIFWEYGDGIKEYQVVQEKLDRLVIKIVTENGFQMRQLDIIREIINRKSNQWNVEFMIVDKIERTRAGKLKFIIRV